MNRHPLLASVAVLLALAPAARAQQPQPRVLVTGTVADSSSGNPLYGVAVATTTGVEHTASDSTGSFTLSIPAGTSMVTFTGRGFQKVAQIVTATEDVDLGRVTLLPDAIALAPINASVSRLEQRARNSPISVRSFDAAWLEHSGAQDMMQVVLHRTGIRSTGCNTLNPTSGGDCFRIRGSAKHPVVFVNEVQYAAVDVLALYRPEDVARLEVYGGGQMIRIYTRPFLEMMERGNFQPDPIFPLK